MIIMNIYKSFIMALEKSRGSWTVDWYTEEAGPCADPVELAKISCEMEGHYTFDFADEIIIETISIFEKAGFKVDHDYESTTRRPILEIIFPK